MTRFLKNKKGFTLLELVMVLTIIGIIAGLVGPFMIVTVDALGLMTTQSNLYEGAATGLERMSRDIRRLRNDESITNATNTAFQFFDIDDNEITYSVSSSVLLRTISPPSLPVTGLVGEVQSVTFSYYDDDGNALLAPTFGIGTATNIRRIEIDLVMQDGSNSLSIQNVVRPRNLRHESDRFF